MLSSSFAFESAMAALLGDIESEPVAAHLAAELVRDVRHAQASVSAAADFLARNKRRPALAAVEHAMHWLVALRKRVDSHGGRREGADPAKLFPRIDAILDELRALRTSL